MATVKQYIWQLGDDLWSVCGRLQAAAGYADLGTMVVAVRAANATVLDWRAVPVGAQVTIPYAVS